MINQNYDELTHILISSVLEDYFKTIDKSLHHSDVLIRDVDALVNSIFKNIISVNFDVKNSDIIIEFKSMDRDQHSDQVVKNVKKNLIILDL